MIEREALDRCPNCGRYTSAEDGYLYLHDDDPAHRLSGAYCNEECFIEKHSEAVKA